MNKRQRKKNLKSKYGIKKIPRKMSIKLADAVWRTVYARLGEELDKILIYGSSDINVAIDRPSIDGLFHPEPSIKVTGRCMITDCLEWWRLKCTGCPFYETVERENDDK